MPPITPLAAETHQRGPYGDADGVLSDTEVATIFSAATWDDHAANIAALLARAERVASKKHRRFLRRLAARRARQTILA